MPSLLATVVETSSPLGIRHKGSNSCLCFYYSCFYLFSCISTFVKLLSYYHLKLFLLHSIHIYQDSLSLLIASSFCKICKLVTVAKALLRSFYFFITVVVWTIHIVFLEILSSHSFSLSILHLSCIEFVENLFLVLKIFSLFSHTKSSPEMSSYTHLHFLYILPMLYGLFYNPTSHVIFF